jgi:DnaK suppressor protein
MARQPKIDIAAMKLWLEGRRAELERLMGASVEDSRPAELDQQRVGRLSRMDAMQVQAMAEETARRRAAELQRVEGALKRIAEDDYGWCTSCGEEIAKKRLENDPATPLCIECASRAS